jgi:hypothetical protein
MASEITYVTGLSVKNGLDYSIQIPQQTVAFDQASPGFGASIVSVPVGSFPQIDFQLSNLNLTTGMVFAQNVSANGATVMWGVRIQGAAAVSVGYLQPGQWIQLPIYGVSECASHLAFSAPSSAAVVQIIALNT